LRFIKAKCERCEFETTRCRATDAKGVVDATRARWRVESCSESDPDSDDGAKSLEVVKTGELDEERARSKSRDEWDGAGDSGKLEARVVFVGVVIEVDLAGDEMVGVTEVGVGGVSVEDSF